MVKRGSSPLPKKLREDAILEAILELRFSSPPIPEVFFGKIINHWISNGYIWRRLQTSDIPLQVRHTLPIVRYAPNFELIGSDSKSSLRVGPFSVSYHRQAPYVGWDKFLPELESVVESLFQAIPEIIIERLGLRYLNALTQSKHQITSVSDLDILFKDSEGQISNNLNFNYTVPVSENSSCTTRISTKEFVQGNIPPDTTVYIDLDVFTNDGFRSSDIEDVKNWISDSHEHEKREFFHLFDSGTIERLKEV